MPEPFALPRDASAPVDAAAHDARDARRWPLLETLHSSFLGLTFAFLGFAPRAIPAALGALAVLTLLEAIRSGISLPRALGSILGQRPLQAAIAVLAFAALSSLWAADRALALQSVAQVGLVVLSAATLTGLLPAHLASLPAPRRLRFVRAVPLGAAAALLFLLSEFASGNAISLALVSRFPGLMGDNAKELVREGDKLIGFVPFYLDRNVAAVTLAMPAVLLAVRCWLEPVRAAWMLGLATMAAVAALALSWSGAAKLAAICGVMAAIAAARSPSRTTSALMAMLVAGVVLALPLGALPSRLGLEKAGWLPPSARERALIWGRTAAAAWRAPLFGIGVQSTRHMSAGDSARVEGVRGPRRELGWHAHNFVLQAWLETGLAGALLLLGLGLATLRSIASLGASHAPAATALFAMVTAIGLTGWGLWQPWLVAVIGVAVAGLWMSYPASREPA